MKKPHVPYVPKQYQNTALIAIGVGLIYFVWWYNQKYINTNMSKYAIMADGRIVALSTLTQAEIDAWEGN